LALVFFGCFLFVYRFGLTAIWVYDTRDWWFGFYRNILFWNSFLAWVPYAAAFVMLLISKFSKSKTSLIALFPLGVLWLIFLPNSPYMITGYLHLIRIGIHDGFEFQPWYDFVMLSVFFLSGLLAGIASLKIVHSIVEKHFGIMIGWASVVVVNFLCGWAVYLGRFIRLNTWYLRDPRVLLPHIRLSNDRVLFIGALSVFLILMYVVMYVFDNSRHSVQSYEVKNL